MNKSLATLLIALSFATPVLAAENIGSSGQDGVSIDLQKAQTQAAACVQLCSRKMNALDQEECVRRCAAPVVEQAIKDGQLTPDQAEAVREAASGKANGARVLPTVNKVNEEITNALKLDREHMKEQLEAAREKMKEAMETRREEMKTEIEKRKAELHDVLEHFKDQRKASTTAAVAEEANNLNKRVTDHYSTIISKLSDLLTRIAAGDTNGDGTADIAAAKTAIDTATAAITTQAGKVYVLTVTTEGNVRNDVQKLRQTLHADLVAVETKVKAAREAVRLAATHVDKPGTSGQTGSSTASTTTQ